MNSLLLIILAIGLYYLLTKNYKTSDYSRPRAAQPKQPFHGNLEQHETGLIVALMAKVAKADGRVSELEAQLISLTLTDLSNVFDRPNEARNALKAIYNKEKEHFENTLIVAQNYRAFTKASYQACVGLMEFLLNLSFIDGEFSKNERMITEDIAKAIGINEADYLRLVVKFKEFYARKASQAAMNETKAYEVLGLNQNSSFQEIKSKYRALVRQHHPDVLMGKGVSQDIIDQATEKLQQINEAYELLKARKG
jgi:DnaJ like chaperone protein